MKVIIVVLVTFVTLAHADVKAPYPPSGWKPQGARLELPTEYGAPSFKQPENLVNQITFTTEATTEGDYETTTVDRAYLPPETTTINVEEERGDPRSVQNLPGLEPPKEFSTQKPQAARFSELEDFKTQFFASQYNLQFAPRSGQLRLGVSNNRQSRLGKLEEEQTPVAPVQQQYGPPTTTPAAKETDQVEEISEEEQEKPKQDQNSAEDEQEDDQSDSESQEESSEDSEPSIAVANAVQTGQYYILAPDNTLQKVQFRTLQTEDDRINHGFTAQLRYQPVEPIKPPVYGYNEEGMLVRILRK